LHCWRRRPRQSGPGGSDQRLLSALLAAATNASLDAALAAGSVGLTIFAPTNAAFNTLATQLGLADATAMAAALPAPALASILSYLVLPARRSAADLVAGGAIHATIYSFGGSAATLSLNTSNGVIHVVDKVLVPPGVLTVVQIVRVNPTSSTLVGKLTAPLVNTLSGAGAFTAFAPTNDAFAAIANVVAGLTAPQLTTVLTYHVLGQQVLSSGIPFEAPVPTVARQSITITAGPAPTIAQITDSTTTGKNIVAVDVRASNGVIHVLSGVLIPNLAN
jgi:uncharacterized surface protein with fasciclin (FAS1) repeats